MKRVSSSSSLNTEGNPTIQEHSLLKTVSTVALVILSGIAVTIAGLAAMGFWTFPHPWIAPSIAISAVSIACVALFFALFYKAVPSSQIPPQDANQKAPVEQSPKIGASSMVTGDDDSSSSTHSHRASQIDDVETGNGQVDHDDEKSSSSSQQEGEPLSLLQEQKTQGDLNAHTMSLDEEAIHLDPLHHNSKMTLEESPSLGSTSSISATLPIEENHEKDASLGGIASSSSSSTDHVEEKKHHHAHATEHRPIGDHHAHRVHTHNQHSLPSSFKSLIPWPYGFHKGYAGPKPFFSFRERPKMDLPTLCPEAGPQNIVEFYTTPTTYHASFFDPKETAARTFSLKEFLAGDTDHISLEDHIFWLFPLMTAHAGKENTVPILDEHTVRTFRQSTPLKINVFHAFKKILNVYGLELNTKKEVAKTFSFFTKGYSHLGVDAIGIAKDVAAKKFNGAGMNRKKEKYFENITQIIHSLNLLGLHESAKSLFHFFNTFEHRNDTIPERTEEHGFRQLAIITDEIQSALEQAANTDYSHFN